MSEQELKPCPFCGEPGAWTVAKRAIAGCVNPFCFGYRINTSDATDWNTRPLEDSLQTRLTAAESSLAEARARVAELEDAINWALGTKSLDGEYIPTRQDGQGAFYWRPELMRRAGLVYDGARFSAPLSSGEQP